MNQFNPTSGSGLSQTIGANMEGKDGRQYGNDIAAIKGGHTKITPVVPEGFKAGEFKEIGDQVEEADSKLSGYNSALLGPKSADLYNNTLGALTGRKVDRTYLSPFADEGVSIIGELMTDPIDMGVNAAQVALTGTLGGLSGLRRGATGGILGGAKAGAKGAMNVPRNMIEEMVDENIEGGVIGGPMYGSIWDYFSPQNTNLLMDNKDPNDADYDEEFERRSIDTRSSLYDAQERYRDRKNELEKPTDLGPGTRARRRR
jgi:hypothetical protein